ncbi:YciI family protein [Microbacter sp. GSS18]|nr:YciI family protein [Microbacter sp. GSS18]
MPTYAARYTYRTDEATAAEKARLRPDHRAFIAGLDESKALMLAGPWGADDPDGGLVVIAADDHAAAAELISNDPYVQAGLLENLTITQWRAVLGPLAAAIPAE